MFIIYKCLIKLFNYISIKYDKLFSYILFFVNGIDFSSFRTTGIPYVMIARGAKDVVFGKHFAMNNGLKGNPIGCNERCSFIVYDSAELIIGNSVGLSQCALVSDCRIKIGDNVKIGGGTCVYTTDFHSLDYKKRQDIVLDRKSRKCSPVEIGDNVFIGAKCIIMKGVTIGENSIIGAGSVVTKSIPENQIWAGNPAVYIRNIDNDNACSTLL